MSSTRQKIEAELSHLKEKNRYRSLQVISTRNGSEISIHGRELINFSSNNYLGLSQNPLVKRAATDAIKSFGAGGESSRLLSGSLLLHQQLEESIAKLKDAQSALVFSTGYMANLGVIPTLIGRDDLILLDRLNHASLVEASFLSGAKIWVYPHKDVRRLGELFRRVQIKSFRQKWVITESLFSMDGDIAPLPELLKLCKRNNAHLMIDEAHATGVLGSNGRGALEHFSIHSQDVEIIMGTLSKALGSLGGFIAGKYDLIEYLCNKSKSFIFTTSLPPSCCAAALKAMEILETDSTHLEKLRENIRYFKRGLQSLGLEFTQDETPIIPILMGDDKKTVEAASFLQNQGIFAPGIRPPTVPEGEGRIRLSISATHKKEHLDKALEAIKRLLLKIKNQKSK